MNLIQIVTKDFMKRLSSRMKYIIPLMWVVLGLLSCTKSPGIGGKASLVGRVEAIYVEKGSFDTLEISAAPDQRVYIVYGAEITQDDATRTSPDGSYKFEYLNPGTYVIYGFSESLTEPSGVEEIREVVEVVKGDQDIVVPTITLIQYVK